jgi:hypothetical protein
MVVEEIRNPNSNVERSARPHGMFHAFWNGRVVFENGRVKRFETESDAWEFLVQCDVVGKIIH